MDDDERSESRTRWFIRETLFAVVIAVLLVEFGFLKTLTITAATSLVMVMVMAMVAVAVAWRRLRSGQIAASDHPKT